MGKAGLEPACREAQDPKSCVYTNFTTCPALSDRKYKNRVLHKGLIVYQPDYNYTAGHRKAS